MVDTRIAQAGVKSLDTESKIVVDYRDSYLDGGKKSWRARALQVGACVAVLAILIGANIAMAITVATLSKDVRVRDDGALTFKGSNTKIVSTSQATSALDLSTAFTLDVDDLRKVSQLILPSEDGSITIYNVQQVRLHPGVSVDFTLQGGLGLEVDSAGVHLTTPSGGTRRLQGDLVLAGKAVVTDTTSLHMDDLYGNGY